MSAPVRFLQNQDVSLRMCIDYMKFNKVIINNNYPIHKIDDLFDQLQEAGHILKIGLRSDYHQLSVREIAFKIWYSYYEFVVISFGLTNTPAIFMDLMNIVFSQYFYLFVIVFIDDIFIYSRNEKEHVNHVKVKSYKLTKITNYSLSLENVSFGCNLILFLVILCLTKGS